MPDIDVFFGWAPWEPLAIHRGFTHGLVGGVLVMPPILAGLLWLLDRWQVEPRQAVQERAADALRLAGRCSATSARSTHPLLDLLTTYSVQLLSPFSDRWFHADGAVHHRRLAVAAARRRHRRVASGASRQGSEWRRLPQVAIGDHPRLHRASTC